MFGQEKQKALKLSASLYRSGIANNPEFFLNGLEKSPTSLFSVGILLLNNEKIHYQEIALTNIAFDKEKRGSNEISQNVLGIRYEYGRLGKQLNDYLSLRYGGYLNFFYGSNHLMPTTTVDFPVEQTSVGVNLAFSPHLDLVLSDRFFIDFNPAFSLISYYLETVQSHNPTLPLGAQKQGTFNLDAGGILIQLGLGYKL